MSVKYIGVIKGMEKMKMETTTEGIGSRGLQENGGGTRKKDPT